MYYKKYFSGSVDATTTTYNYFMGTDKVATGTQGRSGHIKNRSDVIGNALVSTLKDVGFPNAYWDSTAGYLFFDKTNGLCGLYISVVSQYMYFNAGRIKTYPTRIAGADVTGNNGLSDLAISLGTNTNPFSSTGTTASDYAFYVTIKGEPKGIFSISIGKYNDHSYLQTGFWVCMGTDKNTNTKTIGFNMSSSVNPTVTNLSQFMIVDYANIKVYSFGANFVTRSYSLTMSDELVVIIPMFFEYGYLFIDNTFLNPGITTYGFYEIDGDIYYVQQYFMTKCITEV